MVACSALPGVVRVGSSWVPGVCSRPHGVWGAVRTESDDDQSLRAATAVLTTAVRTVALLVLGPAGTASAEVLDVTCAPPGGNNITYTPPVTAAPQDVTVDVTPTRVPQVVAVLRHAGQAVAGDEGSVHDDVGHALAEWVAIVSPGRPLAVELRPIPSSSR